MTVGGLQGLVVLAVFVALMVGFLAVNQRWRPPFRRNPAFDALRQAIERAVEAGERVHVSLGTGSVIGPESAPALAGLAALTRIARATSISDRPVVVTTGDGAMAILARDSLRSTYQGVGASDLYEPTSGRLLGATPLSYAAGLPAVLANERVSVHVLSGAFGGGGGLGGVLGERGGRFGTGGA